MTHATHAKETQMPLIAQPTPRSTLSLNLQVCDECGALVDAGLHAAWHARQAEVEP